MIKKIVLCDSATLRLISTLIWFGDRNRIGTRGVVGLVARVWEWDDWDVARGTGPPGSPPGTGVTHVKRRFGEFGVWKSGTCSLRDRETWFWLSHEI